MRYHDYSINRISNPDPAHSKWSGYASIYWSDSNADGRQDSSEVCRVSGKVDSVRLPKEAYYVYRVMQNDQPGHPHHRPLELSDQHDEDRLCRGEPLRLGGVVRERKICGNHQRPVQLRRFLRRQKLWRHRLHLRVSRSKIRAGRHQSRRHEQRQGRCQEELKTAGEPKNLKLTVHTGPKGLQADGSDVAFFDVEVVDAQGRRCPTDEARVDFKLDGPAIWRGGYNSGKTNSVNNLWLDTECGINRVAIRSVLQPGTITLTATRPGLEPAKIQVESKPVEIVGGLTRETP